MKCPKCKKETCFVYKDKKPIEVLLESLHYNEQSAIIGKMQVSYSRSRHIKHNKKECTKALK